MKIGVMQPYIFPYIGYFQLVNSVDAFVFYDDVNYIKQGRVNRNKILIDAKENLFTIPLKKASSFQLINQTELHSQLYKKWLKKFLRTINQSYNKSQFFSEFFPVIKKVLDQDYNTISELSANSVIELSKYLGLETQFYYSSKEFGQTKTLERADRLIAITRELKGDHYINSIGGVELYDSKYFKEKEIKLSFLSPDIIEYNQGNQNFVGGLSIIDVLMFNSIDEVVDMLNKYELI